MSAKVLLIFPREFHEHGYYNLFVYPVVCIPLSRSKSRDLKQLMEEVKKEIPSLSVNIQDRWNPFRTTSLELWAQWGHQREGILIRILPVICRFEERKAKRSNTK